MSATCVDEPPVAPRRTSSVTWPAPPWFTMVTAVSPSCDSDQSEFQAPPSGEAGGFPDWVHAP